MRQKSNSTPASSETLVRNIRRATRKHHAAEDKIRNLLTHAPHVRFISCCLKRVTIQLDLRKMARRGSGEMAEQGHAAKTTKQATDIDNHASGKGSHITPSIAPPELSIEASSSASPERPIDPSPHAKIPPIASKRLFVGKRLV